MRLKFGSAIFVLSSSLLVLGSQVSTSVIQHANSYSIRNLFNDQCLTATRHTFRPDDGLYVGEVLTSDCGDLPHQLWDAIRWQNSLANQFWLVPKQGLLNELTSISISESEMPSNNMVEIMYLPRSEANGFLIRSMQLNKCIESHGLDFRITYEPCDFAKQEQQWVAKPFTNPDDGYLLLTNCKLRI